MNDRRETHTDLGDQIAVLAAHIDAATSRLLALIAEFDQQQGWAEHGCLSCAHWLSWRLGWTPATARERLRVAHALADLPAISAAVETGAVSYSKARAVTRVATPDSDAEWATTALAATAAQLERIVRSYRRAAASEELVRTRCHQDQRGLHTYYDDDGTLVVRGRLTPEVGALLLEALAARSVGSATLVETFAQQQADALAEVARLALAGSAESAAGEHQVVVHVDAEVLEDPSAVGRSELEGGPGVSAETSRRLACDAHLVEMSHGPHGEVLSVGRRTRVISTPIRRALRVRDRCCRFPSCTNRIADAHHIEHWANGGKTELGNLVLLCRRHHTLVHEGGFGIEHDRDGAPRFVGWRGERVPDVIESPGVDPTGDVLEALVHANAVAGVHIDPMTNYPRWDGEAIDYEWVTAVMGQSAPA